jgi:hypothetical protein
VIKTFPPPKDNAPEQVWCLALCTRPFFLLLLQLLAASECPTKSHATRASLNLDLWSLRWSLRSRFRLTKIRTISLLPLRHRMGDRSKSL